MGTYRAKTSSVKQLGRRRSRKRDWGRWPNSIINTVAPGREAGPTGKHRTEVTEVTEGDWGRWPKFYRSHRGTRARSRPNGKASHGGHRGHGGGTGVGGQNSIGHTVAPGREAGPTGKHRTEVTDRIWFRLLPYADTPTHRHVFPKRSRRMIGFYLSPTRPTPTRRPVASSAVPIDFGR
jgi:hypothetical protein